MYAKSMKISICGSMHHKTEMLQAKEVLEKAGYEVETPDMSEKKDYSILPTEVRANLKDNLIRRQLENITDSDAILVVNYDKNGIENYIGGNTLMEMGFAYAQNIEIFLLNNIPEIGYMDEIIGMKPIMLNGNLSEINQYRDLLPKTYVSSKSPIKLRAVSRGLRRAGIKTQVLPMPTNSGVSEQPQNIEETYEGANNRHDALVAATKDKEPAYLATLESGLYQAHPKHNSFESTVVVLEKVGRQRKVGINVGLEYPREMTDKVPSVYPDLGVLVQQEYGSKLKDPFPYFTGGKVNRLQLMETAVFNVAAQLT